MDRVLVKKTSESAKKGQRGVYLVNRGVQISGPLGPSKMFQQKVVPINRGSNLACLGELGGNLLPLLPINRQNGVVLKIPQPPGYAFQLFWVKKIVFVKKIQAEVLL